MSIVLQNLNKRFGGFPVVNNVSLEIAAGEFFVLLGSSGSGKTTVLNIIAGLTPCDSGRVLLHGQDVTLLSPQKRNIGLVFQNYALFQHMTIAENIEFGLRVRRVAAPTRRKRSETLLELVGLAGLGDRMPRQLSGGQQQRVALARALAAEPAVLLLDEPLGALDAKIRVELRRNLRTVQQTLGIATILVTHDQEEAFDLGDRIGVMNFGRLIEVGTPQELYQRPQTEFVASFLGSSNLLIGTVDAEHVRLGNVNLPLPPNSLALPQHQRVQVLFRPEDVVLTPDRSVLKTAGLGSGVVEAVQFSGAFERLRLRLPALPGVRSIMPPTPFGSSTFVVEATRSPETVAAFPLQIGDTATVGVSRFHALDHLGLNFLLLASGSLRSQVAVSLSGQLARLAHARLTLWIFAQINDVYVQAARKQLGSGLAALTVHNDSRTGLSSAKTAVEEQPYDLAILGYHHAEDHELLKLLLENGEQHLLLIPAPPVMPARALLCVLPGEPAKDAIAFTGRFLRHFGTYVTLLSVLPAAATDAEKTSVRDFLVKGVETLHLFGVEADHQLATGDVTACIEQTVQAINCDLLIAGAHLPGGHQTEQVGNVLSDLCQRFSNMPLLIVKSHFLKS
jgi:sulfate transport system ATP-binding protein